MMPAAVLSVVVQARGVAATNAQLASVQSTLAKTEAAGNAAGASLTRTGKRMETVGKGLTRYVAAPMLAVGVASGVMAAKFHRSINLIATDAGGSKKELDHLSDAILRLSEHSEFGPQKLADALFYVESAGVRGGKAIKDLDQIQRAAMAGNADLESATFGTVGAINALGKEGHNVEKILAIMNATVGHGHLRLEELTHAMSTGTLGAAKTFGIDMEGFGSALGFFTRMSEPAQQAATRLRQTITHLASVSTNKADEALKSIGMNIDRMSEKIHKTHSLGPVILELKEHLEGLSEARKNQVLTDAFGGGRYGTQIREAIANTGLLLRTEKEIEKTSSVNRLHRSERLQEESAEVQMKIAWSKVEASLIRLGDVILPVVVPMLVHLAGAIATAAKWFEGLSSGTQKFLVYAGLLTIALALILRIVGGFMKSLGEIVGYFAGSITATEAQTVANGELAISYEAVAAAAAEARMAQLVEGVPGITSVGPGNMPGAIPGVAAEGEEVAAGATGAGMASKMIGGLTKGIPLAIAAYGVGNVISSAMSGDWQDAGFEGGGALIGGALGALTGNPMIAAAGVGIGSLLGEKASEAFGSIFSPEPVDFRKNVMRRYAGAEHHQMKIAQQATHVMQKHKNVAPREMKQVAKIDKQIAAAEHKVARTRQQYGADTRKAASAETALMLAKERGVAASRNANAAEKLQGQLRLATRRADRAAVQSAKELIEVKKEDIRVTAEQLGKVQAQPPSQARLEKEHKLSKRIQDDVGDINKARKEETEIIRTATTEIDSKFARGLEKLKPLYNRTREAAKASNETVAEFGRKAHQNFMPGVETMSQVVDKYKDVQHGSEKVRKEVDGPFKRQVTDGFNKAGEASTQWAEVTNENLGMTGEEAGKIMEAFGGSSPFKGAKAGGKKAKEVQKKARGGHINIGDASGDSVPALLEKDEYVLNRNAVAAIGRHNLDQINFGAAPRFATGGPVSAAFNDAQRITGTPYVWGGGHASFTINGGLDCSGAVSNVLHAAGLLDRPMTSGEFMNWGKPGAGALTIHANPEHVWMEIAGKPYGTSVDDSSHGLGFYPKPPASYVSSFVTRHANVGAAEGIGGGELPLRELHGPGGKLKSIGNAELKAVHDTAQKYIDKHSPGRWGGGDINVAAGHFGVPELESLWGGAKGPHNVAHEASAIAMAESGGDPKAHNPSGATGLWQILGSLVPGNLYDPKVNALNAVAKYHTALGGDNFSPWEAWTNGAYKSFMAKGGAVELATGGRPDYLKDITKGKARGPGAQLAAQEKAIKHGLHQIKKGHNPKGQGTLRRAAKKIEKVAGLKPDVINDLVQQSTQVGKFNEYASNAQSKATQDAEGNEIPHPFLGRSQTEWLENELSALGTLRNSLIKASKGITGPNKKVHQMLKLSNDRLHAVAKKIHEAERLKERLEKQIKEIEDAENKKKKVVEGEIKTVENSINKAQNKKPVPKESIKVWREQVANMKAGISDNGKKTHEELAEIHKQIRTTEAGITERTHLKDGLENTVIPSLTSKAEDIKSTMESINTTGGSFGSKEFKGIESVQGAVGNMAKITQLQKTPGDLGGEILGVQVELQNLGEKGSVSAGSGSEAAEELLQIEKELNLNLKEALVTSQAQYKVMQNYPGVGTVPYAGQYATGGIVAATVGERGPEVAFMPQGSRVVPHHEAVGALSNSGNHTLQIDEMHIYPDEGSVTMKMGDREFEAKVNKVQKNTSRRSSRPAPGSRR